MLAPRAGASGPVREMLAESLGDQTVSVAYWLPDRERFVDELGRPVELPEPGSGRAWTAVERDGRRVAAIIHDAALDTSRELLQAAAAASCAGARQRAPDARTCRRAWRSCGCRGCGSWRRATPRGGGSSATCTTARSSSSSRSRWTCGCCAGAPTKRSRKIDELSERLATALAELRELARGIHPAILTDRGLAPAIDSLADRATLPVDVEVELPEERLPAPVEAAAYFLVAEALTNVARYAEASSARVDVALRRRGARSCASPTTASAASTRRRAAACAGSTTAWPRSAGRWRSTAAFARADVAVLPYHRSSASGPLQIAMANGLPIVTTAVGGLVEATAGYGGAILVEPRDPHALRAGIEAASRLRFSRFVGGHSVDTTAQRYVELAGRLSSTPAKARRRSRTSLA